MAAGIVGRWWPYLLVAWLYVATSPYHRGLYNPNEMVRVYMSVAAVEHGTFAIDLVVRRFGNVDDKAVRDGALYSSKAPLQSLVGIPAYAVARPLLERLGLPADVRHATFALRYLGAVGFGLALAFVLLAWCRRRARALDAPVGAGTGLGLALALGTMHYPYALTFTGHVLAAGAAGGCFLAAAALGRAEPGSQRWRGLALLAGFLGGATPFAEYPAALVALPALFAAFVETPGLRGRTALFGWLALGGSLPFGLGLWTHQALWGSPFATGYGFLENPSYHAVHDQGFFGVAAPRAEAFFGTLISPGTGLFFFSPFLALGLVPIVRGVVHGRRGTEGWGRAIWVAALAGLALELLFMSSHRGWRGGWTLGPRYIIPVVTVLGFGCAEALGHRRLRPWLMSLGAAAIVLTGPAAALYPHLSDVYSHPLRSFVLPTYLRGEMSYGIGHALGLTGHVANLIHLIPLGVAAVYTAFAGAREGLGGRTMVVLLTAAAVFLVMTRIPEAHPPSARRETRRLWRLWEPRSSWARVTRVGPKRRPTTTARARWSEIRVRRIGPDGTVRPCLPEGRPCRYGDQPWQRFGPDRFALDGVPHRLLFLHPVAKETVEATVPLPAGIRSARLRYGLADASVASSNPHPVRLTVEQAGAIIGVAEAGRDYGFEALDLPLTSTTAPLVIEVEVEEDGARVLGFDVELFADP